MRFTAWTPASAFPSTHRDRAPPAAGPATHDLAQRGIGGRSKGVPDAGQGAAGVGEGVFEGVGHCW